MTRKTKKKAPPTPTPTPEAEPMHPMKAEALKFLEERPKDPEAVKQAVMAPIDKAQQAKPIHRRGPVKIDTRMTLGLAVDYHPDTIPVNKASGASNFARSALDVFYTAWATIRSTAADDRVPLADLSAAADKVYNRMNNTLGQASTKIEGCVKHAVEEVDKVIMQRLEPSLQQEIRAHLNNLPNRGARMEACRSDVRCAAALLTAPACISGMKPDDIELIRGMASEIHAPEQHAALQTALRCQDKVVKAHGKLLREMGPRIEAWRAPSSQNLAKLNSLIQKGE